MRPGAVRSGSTLVALVLSFTNIITNVADDIFRRHFQMKCFASVLWDNACLICIKDFFLISWREILCVNNIVFGGCIQETLKSARSAAETS